MSEAVDVSRLPLQQLGELRKQLEAEIDHLSDSFDKLRQAQAKFVDCAQSVTSASAKSAGGTEIMIPMTSSLYVPGRVAEGSNYIVDVGTNYFVEKSADEAVVFFNSKVDTLSKNLVDVSKLLNDKVSTLRGVDAAFKMKYQEAQKEAKEQQEGQSK